MAKKTTLKTAMEIFLCRRLSLVAQAPGRRYKNFLRGVTVHGATKKRSLEELIQRLELHRAERARVAKALANIKRAKTRESQAPHG